MDWQECEEKMCVSERNKMTGLFLDRDQMAASQKFITEAEAAYQHIESRIRVEEQIAASAKTWIKFDESCGYIVLWLEYLVALNGFDKSDCFYLY